MNCLVTGGAGFIGSNLVDALLSQGHKVLVIDNLSSGKLSNLELAEQSEQFKFLELDVLSDLSYFHFNKIKFDVIYHMAAMARIQPSFNDPLSTIRSNMMGTANVLDLARLMGSRFVYAGSSTFYFDILANPYAFTKWCGEEVCRLYNRIYKIPTGIARFFNVYGNRQLEEGPYSTVIGIFCKQKREGKPLTITGDGNQRRDFTEVRDIVKGLISIDEQFLSTGLYKQYEHLPVFAFGTGINYSINEVANMFETECTYIPKRPGEAKETLADITLSKQILKWEPEYNLRDCIKNMLKG